MTALEASFLNIERPGSPMHVGSVSIIDGPQPITTEELRRMVASRTRGLRRFRERARASHLGLSRPDWERVERLDFDMHVFHHRLRRPGRRSQLFALCARIHEQLLSRDRPLWEMHLIDGLDGGRQALYVKTHHAITDGLAGVELANVLFDKPAPSHVIALKATHFASTVTPSPIAALQSLLGAAFTVAGGPIAGPGPFNGRVGSHRSFGAALLPMGAILHTKRMFGGSVDDVLLAVVAAGLSRYLRQVRYPEMPRSLRAMLPVSTRIPSRRPALGNCVTSVFVDLPLGSSDIRELVSRIAAEKSLLRSAHAAEGGTLAIEAAGLLPNPLHSNLLRFVSSLPFANLVVSDVPGPREPMRLLGRPISATFPLMPLPPMIGLAIAAVSVGDWMGLGVTADPELVPSPQRLADAIEVTLSEAGHWRPEQERTRLAAHRRRAA